MSDLFDRQQAPRFAEKVVLVHVKLDAPQPYFQPSELAELARAAKADIVAQWSIKRHQAEARYFIGSGQLEQLQQILLAHQADLVIFGQPLTPSQERNLSNRLKCRVIDRIRLILDIFALRAQTHEGRLQVELAQLNYLSSRLVRGWTHLERQKGGIGMRGPGETQLEMDRRLIAGRIKVLQKQLHKVQGQRHLSRHARQRNRIPCVALVGYTNAGKSTLFNSLCSSDVFATDLLFATLDTTTRRVHLDGVGDCLLVDTVGFIQQLPHQLIAAFRATLEEVLAADLLLHIIDGSDRRYQEKIDAVEETIHALDAGAIACIKVVNKIDQMSLEQQLYLRQQGLSCQVSALSQQGREPLLAQIATHLSGQQCLYKLTLKGDYSKLRAQLYQVGKVLQEDYNQLGEANIRVRCATASLQKVKQHPAVIAVQLLG